MYEYLGLIVAALAAIYTASYGWWAWRQKHYLGAVGTWVFALVTFGLPLFLILRGEVKI
ncbi:MAG: hypothetical protein QHH02_09265 [Syntrophomonadaceae bacterium]|nr:hypothetical protein [Syntrophomonadaceae bacterium]